MQACWQVLPSGVGAAEVVVVEDAVVTVVLLSVVLLVVPVPAAVPGAVDVVVPMVVDVVVLVVLVVLVLVVLVLVVVVVVVDVATQGQLSSSTIAPCGTRLRRHMRRARLASFTAFRPQFCFRRALLLNAVHERLIEIVRVRAHLLSARMVRVQLPGRPGASSAQTSYWVLKSSVRPMRFSISPSASAQRSLSVLSKQSRQSDGVLHRADAPGGVPSHHPHARTAISTPLRICTSWCGTRNPSGGQLRGSRHARRSSYMPWNMAATSMGAFHASPRSSR